MVFRAAMVLPRFVDSNTVFVPINSAFWFELFITTGVVKRAFGTPAATPAG